MPAITISDLTNAKLDVDHIAAIATSTANTTTDRLGNVKQTMSGVVLGLNAQAAITATGINVALAQTASNVALTARDAANVNGKIYSTTAAGLAAVASGAYFSAPSPNSAEYLILYLNSAGAAVEQKRYPSVSAVQAPITPIRTNFLLPSKNLFDKSSVTLANYQTETGSIQSSTSYDLSEYISVLAGTAYVCNGSGMRFTCYFDASKTVVAGGSGSTVNAFTVPAGVAYVRVTAYLSDLDTAQLEIGSVATTLEPFRYLLQTPNGAPFSADPLSPAVYEGAVIAATTYVPYGKEIAIYHENVIKDYPASKGRTAIEINGGKETGPSTKVVPGIGLSGSSINGYVKTGNANYETLTSTLFRLTVSDAARTIAANVQNIGDSFTGRMTWANVILGTAAATGLTFSGNRNSNSSTIRCEGQGGWTLANYFTVDFNGYLSPFMQPVTAGYKYYGKTSFWIDANAPTPTYNAYYFDSIKTQFNATTGRKISPAVNDVMGDAGGYIVWNGSAWVSIASGTFGGFAFSYAKYRATWAIAQPNIMHILLGTNDFYSSTESSFAATYAAYKTQYDAMIASIKADTPGVKIIVGIPVSSGRQGEFGTLTTERVKRAMWLLAKALNADYGGREAENIYVLDYHSIVDRTYGFDNTAEAPFTDYTGTASSLYKADFTHLSLDGFKQMGNVYMGLIQFLR